MSRDSFNRYQFIDYTTSFFVDFFYQQRINRITIELTILNKLLHMIDTIKSIIFLRRDYIAEVDITELHLKVPKLMFLPKSTLQYVTQIKHKR